MRRQKLEAEKAEKERIRIEEENKRKELQ